MYSSHLLDLPCIVLSFSHHSLKPIFGVDDLSKYVSSPFRYSLLFNYGLPEDGSDFAPDDADANLVPELVAKVAVPILHHEISHCWDILSTAETRNAVSATTLVIDYIPASSEALVELLVAVRTRLSTAVSNLMVCAYNFPGSFYYAF